MHKLSGIISFLVFTPLEVFLKGMRRFFNRKSFVILGLLMGFTEHISLWVKNKGDK